MNFKDERIWIVSLLVAALLLRLWFATTSSLWLDEAFSVVESAKPLSHVLTLNDNTPPLYHLLLHGWMSFLGTSEISVRGLSILFGVLLVLLLWRISGWQAASLAAAWPVLIEYSAQTRTYSLFVLAAVAHLLLARSKDERPVLGALAALGTVLSHAYGILYVAAAQIVSWNRKGRQWHIGQAFAFAVWAAWAAWTFVRMDPGTISWIHHTGLETVPFVWSFLTAGTTLTATGIAFSMAALLAFGLYARKRDELLWAILPVAVAIIAGFFLPVFHPKYVLPSAAGIILALKPMDRRVLTGLVALGLVATVALTSADRHVPWEDIAEAPMQYRPGYAVYPLIYYAAPSCLGETNHRECAERHGLTAGCTAGEILVMDPESPTWSATEHSVGIQDCSVRSVS